MTDTPEALEDRIVVYAPGDRNLIGTTDVATVEVEVTGITILNGKPAAVLVIRATPAPAVDEHAALCGVKGISPTMATDAIDALNKAREAANQ